MKTIFWSTCLLLLLSGFFHWQDIALQIARAARQQLPQPIIELLPNKQAGGFQQITAPGLEKQIAARLTSTLQGLSANESLNQARVGLKQVRFVPTNVGTDTKASDTARNKASQNEEAEEATPATGYYVATINYDLLSPLTLESGTTLLAAACSCGVARVRLSDGYGVIKTFNCPVLRN